MVRRPRGGVVQHVRRRRLPAERRRMGERKVRLQGDSVHGVRSTRRRGGRGREFRDHSGRSQRVSGVDGTRMGSETRPVAVGRGPAQPSGSRRTKDDRGTLRAFRARAAAGRDAEGRRMNFAVTGVAGFVAPRHLKAIKDTGHRLVAAVDPHDAVGVLDRFAFDVRFFTEIERFDRHLEKLRRGPEADRVDYVSVCSPNYLHDAHIRLALRIGAHVICEKPLVINPWNLDALQELENETGRRVNTVLQLRLHPQLIGLRERLVASRPADLYDVGLTYVTARGRWYDVSWKGSDERSGGLV